MNRRDGEAAQRFADRRRREDEAPRLLTLIPKLESLRLDIEERRSGGFAAEASHIRRVVVEHAPALFLLPCRDPSCKDGGHDLTDEVVRALRNGSQQFEGEDACMGQIGTANCPRVLRYVGTATYKP